jgi:hypothetical protein
MSCGLPLALTCAIFHLLVTTLAFLNGLRCSTPHHKTIKGPSFMFEPYGDSMQSSFVALSLDSCETFVLNDFVDERVLEVVDEEDVVIR